MEPPLFIHFYASPLVYSEPESHKKEEIDELDFHAEQKHLQELLSSDQVIAPCRFLTTHCTFSNFSEKVNGCKMLHFTGLRGGKRRKERVGKDITPSMSYLHSCISTYTFFSFSLRGTCFH